MPTTGVDLFNRFKEKVFLPYGTYYNDTRYNTLFKEALFNIIGENYKALIAQKEYDKLRGIIITDYAVVPINNDIDLLGDVGDYLHFLACKTYIEAPEQYAIEDAQVVSGVITVTFEDISPLRSTEMVILGDSFMGLTTPYECYAKQLTKYKYQFYDDITLRTPVTAVTPYNGDGTITRVVDSWTKPYYSDRKIAFFGKPTIYFPKHEFADTVVKLYPRELTHILVKIDYISIGGITIDITDDSTNLETDYPYDMLKMVIDEAARLFKIDMGDYGSAQVIEADLIKRG